MRQDFMRPCYVLIEENAPPFHNNPMWAWILLVVTWRHCIAATFGLFSRFIMRRLNGNSQDGVDGVSVPPTAKTPAC